MKSNQIIGIIIGIVGLIFFILGWIYVNFPGGNNYNFVYWVAISAIIIIIGSIVKDWRE